MAGRSRGMLLRQWGLLRAIQSRRNGASIRVLCEALGASRATVYRDLALLQEAGVPLAVETVSGEVRYRLLGEAVPDLRPTAMQFAALRLARQALVPLDGSALVRELDALLRWPPPKALRSDPVKLTGRRRSAAAGVLGAAERAVTEGRRLRLLYRGRADDRARWRTVDPIDLRLVDRDVYLVACNVADGAVRKFKLARAAAAEVLAEPCVGRNVDVEGLFARSVKVCGGEPTEVVIRLAPKVARFAPEYPLVAEQEVKDLPDGSVEVRATVAGILEATRWVLSWGGDAEVVAPRELRAAVRGELVRALSRYPSPVSIRPSQVVSRIVRREGGRVLAVGGKNSQARSSKVAPSGSPGAKT